MQIQFPVEKALHANCRKQAAHFLFNLVLHSFPKHLLVIRYSVLQLILHSTCFAAVLWAEEPLPGHKWWEEYHCWLQTAENECSIRFFSLQSTQWPYKLFPAMGKTSPFCCLLLETDGACEGRNGVSFGREEQCERTYIKHLNKHYSGRVSTKNIQDFLFVMKLLATQGFMQETSKLFDYEPNWKIYR